MFSMLRKAWRAERHSAENDRQFRQFHYFSSQYSLFTTTSKDGEL